MKPEVRPGMIVENVRNSWIRCQSNRSSSSALTGEVVGFIDFRKNGANWNLHTMIVVPAWQSKGIGSIVLDGLMAATKCISLSVLRTNPRARSLYERKGFREVSSSKTHIHLAWECTNSFESDKLKTTRASN